MTCRPARPQGFAHIPKIGTLQDFSERHVWRRSWRERLFGTVPLKKCECGRVCWMDRAWRRYQWNVFPPEFLRNS